MEQLSVTHCELARDPPFFCLLFGCVLPARLHTPLYWGSNTLCFSVVALLCCCRSATSSSLLSSTSSLILKQCLVPLLHNFLNYIFFSFLLAFFFFAFCFIVIFCYCFCYPSGCSSSAYYPLPLFHLLSRCSNM